MRTIIKSLSYILVSFIIISSSLAQSPERKDVPDQHKWNLSDIYPTTADWQADVDMMKGEVEKLAAFKGTLGKSAADLYTALKTSSDLVKTLSKAWQADNPAILTRVIAEFQAGRTGADLIMSDSIMPVLRSAGAITAYETVQRDSLIIHDPTMPTVSLQIQTLGYNTKRMAAEDLPKSWEDVANPKYKGIVALDDPMRGGPLTIQLAILKGSWKDDAKWTSFVKGLKALNVPVHRSTGAMFRLLVAGEYSITEPCLLHDLLKEKEKYLQGYLRGGLPADGAGA